MGVKQIFQKWTLSKVIKSNKRVKVFNNLAQIKRVGIVFERTDDTLAKQVGQLAKLLYEHQIEINVIAYVNLKKPTEELEQKKVLTLFYNKDITWIGKPKLEELQEFASQKFDLLIKADYSNAFPIQYICAASQALLIAGPNDELRNIYDLIIEVNENNIIDFHQQLIHYLSIINNTQ